MANTTFTSGTVIVSPWLQDVNDYVYRGVTPGTPLSSSNISFIQNGIGATTRTVQSELRDSASVKQYGAIGDGATNDYAAFTSALVANSGKLVRAPAGTYKLPFTGTNAIVPPANIVIEGDGPGITTLRFEPSSSTYRNLFNLTSGGLTLRNLTVSVVAQSGQTLAFFVVDSNGVKFDNCDFNGGMTNAGAVLSHTAHFISFPNAGTQTDIDATDCDIHGFSFGLLKTNAATSVQQRISFEHCDLYNNYNEDLAFNSPLGSMDDVQIYMCRFRDGAGAGASLQQLYASFASITEFHVGGCTFEGTVAEAIHIEENCKGGTITGNTINVDGYGITVTDNNISGTSYIPQFLTISGNTVRKAGTAKSAGSKGIALTYDASPEVPAKNIVVQGNTVTSYDVGFITATTLDDACTVSDNVADNCTRGFQAEFGSYNFSRNTSKGCDTGLYNSTWGTFDKHTFINCTVNADAVSRPIALIDPVFLFPEFSTTAGSTTFKNLLGASASDKFQGTLNTSVFSTSVITSNVNRRDDVSWDGATFSTTNKIVNSPGSITVTPVRNASLLALSIFTTNVETGVSVQAQLNGMAIIAI